MGGALQAGEYDLRAHLRGSNASPSSCKVAVSPGPTSALHSRSDMSGLEQWRAGEQGTLRIFRKDKYVLWLKSLKNFLSCTIAMLSGRVSEHSGLSRLARGLLDWQS
jgi:hypothetical protein